MSYTVQYQGTKAEKEAQALRDCETWLGTERFKALGADMAAHIRAQGGLSAVRQGIRMMAMAGIQGYPAKVFVIRALRAHG